MSEIVKPQVERKTDLVEWAECPRPVPRYQTDLPWVYTDDEVIAAISERILSAESIEAVLTLSEPTKMEDMPGRRILIGGFVMRPSDLDEGPGGYAMIAYTDADTLEPGFSSTGAAGVVAQLARAWELGSFPFACTVTQIESKSKGHKGPLYLTRIKQITSPGDPEPF